MSSARYLKHVGWGITTALLFSISATSVMAAKSQITVFWRDNGAELKALKEAGTAFEKKYGINVKVLSSSQDSGDDKLYSMIVSGVAPDLFSSVFHSGLMDYVKRGFCLDLTPYIKRDKFPANRFYPVALKRLQIEGRQIGIPLGGSMSGIYCNVDMFRSSGVTLPPSNWKSSEWSWDDMVAAGKRLSRDVNGDGKLDQSGIDFDMYSSYGATSLTWMWGGDFFPASAYDTGLAAKSLISSTNTVAALKKLADLKFVQRIWAKPGDNASGGIAGGKVAMQEGGAWNVTAMDTLKRKYHYAAAIRPKGTTRTPIVYTDPWLVFKNSKNKEGAWKFIRFMTLEEGAKIFSNGYVGQMLTKEGSTEFAKRLDWLDHIETVTDGAWDIGEETPNHRLAGYSELDTIITAGLAPLWNGTADAQSVAVATASKLDKSLKKTYDRFVKK